MSWQPIETAPRDGTLILLAGNAQMVSGRWREAIPERNEPFGGGWFWARAIPAMWELVDGTGMTFVSPTHWQPLPEPP